MVFSEVKKSRVCSKEVTGGSRKVTKKEGEDACVHSRALNVRVRRVDIHADQRRRAPVTNSNYYSYLINVLVLSNSNHSSYLTVTIIHAWQV